MYNACKVASRGPQHSMALKASITAQAIKAGAVLTSLTQGRVMCV